MLGASLQLGHLILTGTQALGNGALSRTLFLNQGVCARDRAAGSRAQMLQQALLGVEILHHVRQPRAKLACAGVGGGARRLGGRVVVLGFLLGLQRLQGRELLKLLGCVTHD